MSRVQHGPQLTLPTGTVTFLFTDIEGSTRLWEEYPEETRAALVRHDELIEAAVAQHEGSVVRPRGEGDSRFAVFSRATGAVAAAAALQKALFVEQWTTRTPVKVRAALHTGEADLREGDYYGSAVNRCARLRAAAHGGQTLISQVTSVLVNDDLPAGVQLRDLGEQPLKDLQRPEHIFQLVVEGLPGDFPPLNTLDKRPNNLPIQATPLIGREKEVTEVCALLRHTETRLLTLVGPGGTGKTRMALQAGAELIDEFADGVFFVALAPISDPGLVLSTIAQSLGVKEFGARPLIDTLKDYLGGKQMLLLLDNFEQIMEAATHVRDILSGASGLKVLVTSREALRIYGEKEYPVPPLDLPDIKHLPSLDRLMQYEAVRLFIERAQGVKPDFQVTNENAPAVAEICFRLDGLPLAIELAAARIRLLPPEAMLARLDGRLRLLTGGARDLPARQQTLRGAISWSYDLLDGEEQKLFRRLGIFVGGCTLEAIEVVASALASESAGPLLATSHSPLATTDIDVLDGMQSLIAKSLVRQDEQASGYAAGEPRFWMLETIREYALERLAESGEAIETGRLHAEYYLRLSEEGEPRVRGREQLAMLDRLEAEHDNLRSAMHFSRDQGLSEMEIGLALGLWFFWKTRGYLSEGRRWFEDWLGREAGRTALRANALRCAGVLAWEMDDMAAAYDLATENVAIWRELGEPGIFTGLGASLGQQAAAAQFSGHPGVALQAVEEVLRLLPQADDPWYSGMVLLQLGLVTMWGLPGDLAHSRSYLEEGLQFFRKAGDRWGISQMANSLGDISRIEGDYAPAEKRYAESQVLYRELGLRREIPASLHNLGYAVLAQGDRRRAASLFAESLVLHRELGNKGGMVEVIAGLGGVAAARGQPERAARLFGAADALYRAFDITIWPADRADNDRASATARKQLGQAAWEKAWAEGQAMSIEEATAYALSEEP